MTPTESPSDEVRALRAFVSHASEDKPFVKQLVDSLLRMGIAAWYDGYEIRAGDSIRDKVNDGLRTSGWGVVVLTPSFFDKRWTKRELASLADMVEDGNLIPVVREMTIEQLKQHDPLLGDIRAIMSTAGAGDSKSVATEIADKIRGPQQVDAEGRTVYTGPAPIRIVDLPVRGSNGYLENIRFHDVVIQGLAVLYIGTNCSFSENYEMHPAMFWPIDPQRPYTGSIGLNNVVFERCRFKEIGIAAPPHVIQRFFDQPADGPPPPLPERLR